MIPMVGNLFMIIKNTRRIKMKKLLAIVSIILLLTVACKQEAVEEAAPAVDELKSTVEELAPAETVQ